MTYPQLSKRKIDAISTGVFLICLGILFYTHLWWPGILVAIWAQLALKQYLSGRIFDLFVSTFVLLGLAAIAATRLDWSVILPILFVVGGIYLIFREFFFGESKLDEEKAQKFNDDNDDGKYS